ncbi:hypothetical protein FJMB80055_36520 [Enterobacter hormaechei]|nr:hypothetical protein FJMB80004_04700 [Enterobacter hormaechei]BDJ06006.1 hypothetical protein FJMB80008_04710 [Enterobacter hormaechei]BDJ30479.1 hypothetical protein FJMB80017_04710 [Enterobacter hormaechei]BDJ35504.1 hypothetical protein FJMB80019_04710 [Enterobacter hormaechei]BDJ50154.1 hypothetical protein FJMB80024_04720 [Enterobacter hormaechei]
MVKGVMTCAQAYSFNVTAKMGTFPKSGEDHNNPFKKIMTGGLE